MLILVLGLLLFFSVHMVPSSPSLRAGLADRFGVVPYKVGFSVLSLIALILIIIGYHKLQIMPGKNEILWYPPEWMRHVTFLLMIPAMILLVAAEIPSRIRTAAKHPMLAGVKIWALAHLLSNGDLGSILLFGSFLAYAVYARISAKRRGTTGRLGDRTGGPMNDVLVVVIGLALYAGIMFWAHEHLIGKAIVDMS